VAKDHRAIGTIHAEENGKWKNKQLQGVVCKRSRL